MLFFSVVILSFSESLQMERSFTEKNQSKGMSKERRFRRYESISTVSLCQSGLPYALCSAFLAFSETARASVKVLGKMSTTDTVVPTRFAV